MAPTCEDNRSPKETARRAVYFAREDYAGFWRRAIIACVDLVAVLLISFAVVIAAAAVWLALYPEGPDLPPALLLLFPLTVFVYLTIVKRSRIGSLGFLLTGVRIVDVEGKRPSLLRMTARFFWLLPLPLGLLLDLGWLLEEPARQTLRDKWAGTFVVKRKARPIGWAPITFKRICLVGVQLIVPEIDTSRALERASENTESPSP